MNDSPTTLQGILDIEPPAMPAAVALEHYAIDIIPFGLVAVGLLLLIGLFIFRRYFSVRGRAQRQLNQLKNQLADKQANTHQLAFIIANTLQCGLDLQQLSARTALPKTLNPQKSRWDDFVERLSDARYARSEQPAEHLLQLLQDAQHWLRCWPKTAP